MSKLEFRPEDFYYSPTIGEATADEFREMADKANARLAEMLKEAPEVFACRNPEGEFTPWDSKQSKDRISGDTHRARLVNIEEIKP